MSASIGNYTFTPYTQTFINIGDNDKYKKCYIAFQTVKELAKHKMIKFELVEDFIGVMESLIESGDL